MIEVHRDGAVEFVRLNRPEVRNAFHPELILGLTKIFQKLKQDQKLRAVVIEGQGKVFCAGADLNWMQSLVGYSLKKNKIDAENLRKMFLAIWDCPVPVFCKVQGAAFGGALGLMAVSDFVVCDQQAQLSFSEVKLGIAPAVISEFVLKKCSLSFVGHHMLSGSIFSGTEAQQMGLAHKVAKLEDLEKEIQQALENLLRAGPEAVRATKKLLRKNQPATLPSVIAKLRVSPEGQEGLKAFLEKRKPHWITT